MTKISIAILTAAAFAYAVWLTVLRRPLPEPGRLTGWRRRFVLATLLFAALLQAGCENRINPRPDPNAAVLTLPSITARSAAGGEIMATLQEVWQTLDPNRSLEFCQKLQVAVSEGIIYRIVADTLAGAFSELADCARQSEASNPHKTTLPAHSDAPNPHERSASSGAPNAPSSSPELNRAILRARKAAYAQIDLLRKARKTGPVDNQTAEHTCQLLAREFEVLRCIRPGPGFRGVFQVSNTVESYQRGELTPGAVAESAAEIVVRWEGGPSFPQRTRSFSQVYEQVDELLNRGPFANDWQDPHIRPNMHEVLQEAGLLSSGTRVDCYDRAAFPVKARSDELEKLQRELLDRYVQAGVLDVETAEKAATAANREPDPKHATQPEVQDYQRRLRKTIRLLYRNGELTSSYVQELEEAACVDIIAFNPAKALRHDMRYYLRSALHGRTGTLILNQLQKRNLIPPAANHRLIFDMWFETGMDIPADRMRQLREKEREKRKKEDDLLAALIPLIDADADCDLPGDSQRSIPRKWIPADETQYRLKMRRIIRILVRSKLIEQDRLPELESLIGIPIVGRLEGP